MPEISINTPALLFPAISLIMLAYTNRFFAIANRVRNLHDDYAKAENKDIVLKQIKNLRRRLNLIRYMQALAVCSFIGCMLCMFFILGGYAIAVNIILAVSILSLTASLFISLHEIFISTHAVELELSDMVGLDKNSILDIFKRR